MLATYSATAARHERFHRQMLFTSLTALCLLATAPVITHHFALGDVVLLDALGAFGDVCRFALYRLLAPVHALAHVLLIVGFAYAVWDRVRAWRRLRQVLGHTCGHVPRPGDEVWRAADNAGIASASISVVPSLGVPAFTAGWLRPRIFVARELVDWLSEDELVAVLAHEGAHARRRDPLRLSLLRFLACWFFWLPALRRLADDIADETEVVADDAAASEPLTLASAIVTLASWPTPALRSTDGIAQFVAQDVVERRVLRLAGVPFASRSRVTWRSTVAAMAALALSWTAGAAVAHPPADRLTHGDVQCMPHHAPRHWLHIFCPPSHHMAAAQPGAGSGAMPCPCQ